MLRFDPSRRVPAAAASRACLAGLLDRLLIAGQKDLVDLRPARLRMLRAAGYGGVLCGAPGGDEAVNACLEGALSSA